MQVLSPSKIHDLKKDEEDQTRVRVSGLAEEESRLVRSINLLKQKEEDIIKEQKEKRDKESKTISSTQAELNILQNQVVSLEARKAEALKPANEKMAEAQKVLADAREYSKKLSVREVEITKSERTLVVRAEKLQKGEEDLNGKIDAVNLREIKVQGAEEAVQKSANLLSEKWVAYETAFADREQSIKDREQKVRVDSEANEIERKVLEERKKKQDEKDREIADKYATLERTIKRLNKTND